MVNSKKLSPWVIIDNDGNVVTGHCDCVAGLAETCTHVAALLFKIEAVVRVRQRTTVTGVAAYWMLPSSVDKVGPKVSLIQFLFRRYSCTLFVWHGCQGVNELVLKNKVFTRFTSRHPKVIDSGHRLMSHRSA